ncbi:MAG: hypothetical protein J6X87_03425 [Clostridia bacterium]|nr:hypothetical protein [Clostridia bacterium]
MRRTNRKNSRRTARLLTGMKRAALCLLCITLLAGAAGCKITPADDPPIPVSGNEVHIMNGIVYEPTKNLQKTGEHVVLTVPHPNGITTGTAAAAYVNLDIGTEGCNYYVVDWGDGTWSYNGPFASEESYKVTAEVYHTYRKAGEYNVKACSVNLTAGTLYGWTEAKAVKVSGDDFPGDMIADVVPICSSFAGEGFECENIADGSNATRWQSEVSGAAASEDSEGVEQFVGYLFDGYYTLDTLEIKFPADAPVFPSNISVEYTTDGGRVWYMLPHYYYVLPNSEGYYSCVMNFPDPMGATLSLPLDGIAANGIRVKCLTYPSYSPDNNSFSVEEMRAYGTKGTFFFTSYDGYYNADLSNMWTIFGTAKTEPRVYNAVGNGGQNPAEFRAGATMTASIEWTEWNGLQLDWSGYDEALQIHVNSLKKAVYGGDGWYYDEEKGKYVVDKSEYKGNPNDDGFIWATSSAPQHLDAQNHYTNNSALIIASRDYLLTGNDTEGFLESKNAKGQVMLDKLRKAMEYMLVNLSGESGLMTIYDPRNDGTVRGMASNYWDSLNFFGYNSAYENILFYQAILAMGDIEAFIGNTSEAERYAALAEKVKAKFNSYFWDNSKGRYITSVNVKGDVLDFGVTFVNFMAVSAGLASQEQAQQIYDWVDGKRIIKSDTSTGADIYNFKVSARSNTVAVETIEEDGLHYWWYNGHSFADVLPGQWGEYGNQMQNGGTIFYTSFYDVSGRALVSGDLAISRFNTIMEEFHKDSLRRAPRPLPGNFYQVSIVGEFPESGLVPLSFLTSIIGVNPDVKGLKIESRLPSDMDFAGVSEYNYANRKYSITVDKSLTEPSVTSANGVINVKVPAGKTFFITPDSKVVEG